MADETRTPLRLEGIDLQKTFPFTRLFSIFRVAIHPSKLLLALVAILLIYGFGRLLDGIWPGAYSAVPVGLSDSFGEDPARLARTLEDRDTISYSEILAFERIGFGEGTAAFNRTRAEARERILEAGQSLRARVAELDGVEATTTADDVDLGDVKAYFVKQRAEDVEAIHKAQIQEPAERLEAANKALSEAEGDEARTAAREAVERAEEAVEAGKEAYDVQVAAAYRGASRAARLAGYEKGIGLFDAYYKYSANQIDGIAQGVLSLDFLGERGVISSLYRLVVVGPAWALLVHPVYFILFFLFALCVTAVFGGAIARIAAVHVAREEKISLRDALRFSTGKFLSFLTAPLIPLVIIVLFGLLVALGGILANVPYVGPIVVGAFFFLALLAGFLMTLVIIGLIGGFNLMYPTIAVEGSDSFDAISRSFSYLYAKPWRLIFYSAVALIYVSLTYLFLRLFFWVLLASTYFAVKLFVFTNDSYPGVGPFEAMWGGPNGPFNLSYPMDYFSLGVAESIAAFLIAFWVYLLIGLLGAYVVSAFFSANTIIYYLMRREVDAQEMDDVYLEHDEDEFESDPIADTSAGGSSAGATSSEGPDGIAEQPTAAAPAAPAGTAGAASEPSATLSEGAQATAAGTEGPAYHDPTAGEPSSEDVNPDDVKPDEAKPDEAKPDEAKPDETKPDEGGEKKD